MTAKTQSKRLANADQLQDIDPFHSSVDWVLVESTGRRWRQGVKHRMKPSDGTHASAVGLSGQGDHAPLVVYASKGKTLLWAFLTLSLAVVSVVVPRVLSPQEAVGFFDIYDNPTVVVFMRVVLGALFCGIFIRILSILLSSAPRVVVSHEGIRVNSLVFGSATIPWVEMSGLLVVGRRWPPLARLHIVLRDRQTLQDRQNRLQGLLWRLGGYSLSWPQSITVPDVLLPMSAEELLARIRIRFQPELVQHGVRSMVTTY